MFRIVWTGLGVAAVLSCLGSASAFAVSIGGVTVAGNTPISFNAAAGAAILTDNVVDDNDWLTTPWTSLGWVDSNWNINPALSSDSGVPQPQLTFDLGGTYLVNSVTVFYTIDHLGGDPTRNLRAPDVMTATLSATGAGGPFFAPVTQFGWDDSDDAGDSSTSGLGVVRSLTTNLFGVPANAVRLDFFTDGEFLFLSEISFDGRAVPEPGALGLVAVAIGSLTATAFGSRVRRRS